MKDKAKLYDLKSVLKSNSFDVIIVTKIPFFRVFFNVKLGRSSLQFVATICLMKHIYMMKTDRGRHTIELLKAKHSLVQRKKEMKINLE